MLSWQLFASGQPIVTSLLPAARLTGTATVRQESQLLVVGRLTDVAAAEPTWTDTGRGAVCALA